jgi:hypothetical protein
MTLCLMVYNIAERKMRQELKKNGNQMGVTPLPLF